MYIIYNIVQEFVKRFMDFNRNIKSLLIIDTFYIFIYIFLSNYKYNK